MPLCGNLRCPSLAVLATGLLSVSPVSILAQSTNVICLSQFNYLDNSHNQNPCLLSAYLQGACSGGQFTINALPPGYQYIGPSADGQNPCQCSSVTYNALSACGCCQNHTIISWSVWKTNCTTVYPGVFPPGVPDGTAIPQWAFQDVTTSDMFNATLAQIVGDNPESTATHVQSTISTLTPTLTHSVTPTPTPPVPNPAPSPNTGAIAGGVVGGVFAIALIAGVIIFFVMKKKRSQIPPSAQFSGGHALPHQPTGIYTDSTPFPAQMAQPKPYDPSDPSTFPSSPPPITTGPTHDVPSGPHYTTSLVRPGGYSGMPEV